MAGKIIDGQKVAASILQKVKSEVTQLRKKGVTPKLTVIQVGNNPASTIYVNRKHKTCLKLGIDSEIKRFPASISYDKMLNEIKKLNNDKKVHGILVQLPLPDHLMKKNILETIDPAKDVDCLTAYDQGKTLLGREGFNPATPKGIITLLESTKTKLEGKNAVVVGRSNIVGKPIAVMLLNRGCTVTICHSKTRNLSDFTKRADILVVAIGKPRFIKASAVKKGAIVIDVGINRVGNEELAGDVDFGTVIKKASWITPVPKGVGPMTIASLMQNTVKACRDIEWRM